MIGICCITSLEPLYIAMNSIMYLVMSQEVVYLSLLSGYRRQRHKSRRAAT